MFMGHHMTNFRQLVLLPLALAAWSAEYQQLTFRDGSVKTGHLDEEKSTLTLTDGSTITIRLKDIVRRETVAPDGKPLPIPPVPTLPEIPAGKPPARAATADGERKAD